MDTNWCLTCMRPVQARHATRAAPYCSAACAQAAYSSPPASAAGGTAIPHLLRSYPSPTLQQQQQGKHRTASFASTASTQSNTSREEWAHDLRGSLSPTAASASASSSSSSVSSQEHPPPQGAVPVTGRPRASSAAYKPVSAPIHPAAASYIYRPPIPASLGPAYTFAADLRAALPPTPPKSAESVRRAAVVPLEPAHEEWETTPAPSDSEEGFHGRGHDRAYYHRPARAPPSRYAYLDPESYSAAGAEPRESRDRPLAQAQAQRVGGRAKPIRIVGTDEGPGVRRLVGGFGEEEEEAGKARGRPVMQGQAQAQAQHVMPPGTMQQVTVRGRVVEPDRGRERGRRR
ncbi:hypothetical protein CALVIDRAFT_291753 [Calocera viscosa TUFC12733]|uniref:Uncharacterized protein n=1 Tax=Calocera viscosa (strain TUFC12733) TaxID=1330018 RepID=A0A167IT70_CALVF|nr:hypothetical protein CALVIDRAFT_291753 [Calocera viscosa TUFC12733]